MRNPPPMLGEHTDAVLMALGYCRSAIDELRRSETI
jgi:crotonobetainyl-CoA:carnitine CoA-transferase CaiB-like acyl-CoA transferase